MRLALSQKDWQAAGQYLQKAEQIAHRSPRSVEIERLHALQARLQLAQGNLAEAGLWAETLEAEMTGAEDTAHFVPNHEFALLTLARIWLAQGKANQAVALLEQVRLGAEETGRGGRALEAQMLQSLAGLAAGKELQALEVFIEVLTKAAPERYTRLFIEEGPPLAKLLYQVTMQATPDLGEYAGRLLAAYLKEQAKWSGYSPGNLPGAAPAEPLSKREIEVLRLMANGCSNKEIAARLMISIGTVKRHVVHIFQKLGAGNRTQAVGIARELGII